MIGDKFRKSVLQLAVQGRLVPQDPADEPASVLLERIRKERARLLRKGEIKKDPRWNSLDGLEALPQGWTWCRLGELCRKIGSGSTPRGGKSVYSSSGIPFLRSQNITDEGLSLKNVAYISEDIHAKMAATEVHGGDILLNITGASLGRCALVDDDFAGANVSQHVTILRMLDPGLRFYIHTLLLSPQIQALIWARQVGVAREGLSRGTLQQFEIPVPPLAEQKRIVSAVHRLLPKISEYEKAEKKIHQVTVSFAPALKKSVLQSAVEGKLVPQDPADEPASVLLEKIRAQKKALVKAGKLGKAKTDSRIFRGASTIRDTVPGRFYEERTGGKIVDITDDLPFEIPESWEWSRLQELVEKDIKRGKGPKYAFCSAIRVLAQKCNLKSGIFDISLSKFLDESTFKKYVEDDYLREEDIIINSTGEGTLGRVGFFLNKYRIDEKSIVADSHITVVRGVGKLNKRFLFFILKYYQPELERNGSGSTKQTELSPRLISELFIPLPPLAEQKRIVAALDEILPRVSSLSV